MKTEAEIKKYLKELQDENTEDYPEGDYNVWEASKCMLQWVLGEYDGS